MGLCYDVSSNVYLLSLCDIFSESFGRFNVTYIELSLMGGRHLSLN